MVTKTGSKPSSAPVWKTPAARPVHARENVMQLQRAVGNRAFGTLLNPPPWPIQAKLRVGSVGDPLEHEADRVAEQVMGMPEPRAAARPAVSSDIPGARRKCSCGGSCDKCQGEQGQEHEKLQMKRSGPGDSGQTAAPPIVHGVLSSPGQPLDEAARTLMEPRFGRDFSHVRVHADTQASDSVRGLNALAYTVGNDVVFDAGQYTMGSNEGRKLIAHELAHVVQQGFTTQVIQRKDDKKKKAATTNFKLIFNEIKTRNPDLAELITPQSIDPKLQKDPPAIKGGPLKDGQEHIWRVSVTAVQGLNSKIGRGREKETKAKGHKQVTHVLNIQWGLPLASDPEFVKQTKSENEAFTLTAAEPLFHELLHARIMMEGDPHWTSQHTQVFQDFTTLMQIADSSVVDKERKSLRQVIGQMAAGGGEDVARAQDQFYEFLVHEKYDADTEGKAFGKSYPNALIAQRYSAVVARSLGAGDPAFKVLISKLTATAENFFDRLDQAAKPSTPSTP